MEQNTIKGRFKMSRGRRKEAIFYWAILAFPLLQFFLMYVCVNFNSFLLAFKHYEINAEDASKVITFAGFDNFKLFLYNVFQGEQLGTMFKNSLVFFFFSTGVGTTLTLLFSFYITKRYKATEFFKFMLILPSVISPVAFVLIFKYVADFAIPELLGVQGLLMGTTSQKFTTITLFNIFIGFGSGVLMYSNAMSKIPDSITESCKLEGCGPLREFFSMTLPLIYPTIETFLIIGISALFTQQANLFTFYTNSAHPSLRTIGYELYLMVFQDRATMAEFPYASAAGLTLTAITIPLVLVSKHFLNKLDKGVEF